MRRALVAGLCAPLLIAAQSDAHVDHIDSDKGAAWDVLADAAATRTRTVTVATVPTSVDPHIMTVGLIPVPVVAGPRRTSATPIGAGSATMTMPATVVSNPGVLEVTLTQILTTLGQTLTLPPHPTGVPFELNDKKNAWRFNDTAPDCTANKGQKRNVTECRIRRCMWDHTKPLNITRAWPAVQFPIEWTNATAPFRNNANPIDVTFVSGQYHEVWVEQRTLLSSQLHWGTTADGLYYPHRTLMSSVLARPTTVKIGSNTLVLPRTGTTMTHVERVFPTSQAPHKDIQSAPSCSSLEECAEQCAVEERKRASSHKKMRIGLLAGFGAALGVLALLTCLCCCHRRRKTKREAQDTGAVPPPNPATTTVTQTAPGQPAGTLGRQAEEGRGRVHFPEGEAGEKPAAATAVVTDHAGDAPKKVVEAPAGATEKVTAEKPAVEKAVVAPAEHVETIPAHDGADSRPTGSLRHDMGSMRGRKKIRADLKNLF
ncbi:hypothetical protein CKM354_000330500 [Cercospora kikuchii]|uniref:Uncharacterized protein n=1 Tax=Cercospora kikuchii TaxID=84275 RepID=A0A9P3FEN4_9PEZI|nr:uncharacterized protein CKM354_000330500 [Cercospora kikuchii]GIZ39944.1 hypothetical protein CKM354_000330500 [Cercospora kikuchii]